MYIGVMDGGQGVDITMTDRGADQGRADEGYQGVHDTELRAAFPIRRHCISDWGCKFLLKSTVKNVCRKARSAARNRQVILWVTWISKNSCSVSKTGSRTVVPKQSRKPQSFFLPLVLLTQMIFGLIRS